MINPRVMFPVFFCLFEMSNGSTTTRTIKGCSSLDDATIEGDNIAEENGWEMLQIDEK
jgi:hypothetical protein